MINLSIDNENAVQENFLGNGAIYHCYAEIPDKDGRQYNSELAEIEADRAGRMKLKIARTFYLWYAWDEEKKCWDWNNERCKALYRWLDRMKKNNTMVALNTGWCCPGDINNTTWAGVSPFVVEGDWDKSLQNYADWVSETAHQLIELRGYDNIKIFVMFTEPRKPSGKMPFENSGFSESNREPMFKLWGQCVDAADAALKRDGRRNLVWLMGPNCGHILSSEMLKWTVENNKSIDIYSSHTYQVIKEIADIDERPKVNGLASFLLPIPGARIQQSVKLAKNTDYEMRLKIKVSCPDKMHISGSIAIGAFDKNNFYITAGGDPTNRLTQHSVINLDASLFGEHFEERSIKFNSENNKEANIGIFADAKGKDVIVAVDDIRLIDLSTGKDLIINGMFKDVYNNWDYYACGGTSDVYYDWCRWCKIGLQYVPKNRMFIFDEYNDISDKDYSRDNHGAAVVVSAVAQMNSGVTASMLWTLFDQLWPNSHTTNNDAFVDGDHRYGVAPRLTRSLVPYKSYYAFSLLSKYTGGKNSMVFEGCGNDKIQLTMNKMEDGNVTIVVVNYKDKADEFSISFKNSLGLKLYRHRFDPATCVPNEKAEIIPADKTFDNISNTLSDNIGAYSVSVYTTYKD